MKNPIKMDDLGVYTPIFGNTQLTLLEDGIQNPYFAACDGCMHVKKNDSCWVV